MEIRELTCIGCPLGCTVAVSLENGVIVRVTGNTCRRGDAYARAEVTHPTRTVTGTVRVLGGTAPVVPVKTADAIPKDRVLACAEALRQITARAPIEAGDVILSDAVGTGTAVIASKAVPVAQ